MLGLPAMIAIYRALFVVSLLLLVASLIAPARTITPIGRRLITHADDWSIRVNTTNHFVLGVTEEQSKTMLLQYFQKHGTDDEFPLGWLTLGAVVSVVFSFVGWRREVYWQKRGQKQ
jgi:hypothetical protein